MADVLLLWHGALAVVHGSGPVKILPKGQLESNLLKRQFWKWHDQGNNLGGCRILGFDKGANKNRLTLPLGTPTFANRKEIANIEFSQSAKTSCFK